MANPLVLFIVFSGTSISKNLFKLSETNLSERVIRHVLLFLWRSIHCSKRQSGAPAPLPVQPSVPPLHVSHAAQPASLQSRLPALILDMRGLQSTDVSAASTEIAMSSPKKSARTSPFDSIQIFSHKPGLSARHTNTSDPWENSQSPLHIPTASRDEASKDVLRQEGVEVLGDAIQFAIRQGQDHRVFCMPEQVLDYIEWL